MAFITLNRENFYHNLTQIALKTGSKDKIAMVLKDNAYGHGLKEMAKLSFDFGIKHAVVRTTKEANEIEGLFASILVLDDVAIVTRTYHYVLNSLLSIKEAEENAKVELKIDTGMHRNGIAMEELEEALALIAIKGLKLVGVMTHYRSADVLSSEFFWQQKNFEEVKAVLKKFNLQKVRIHSHNSASIFRTKNFTEDLVRVGIGAYGFNELPSLFDEIKLKPVLSLYGTKIASRVLKKGQRVGYGGDFTAPKDMIISSYNIGYGDGWARAEYLNKCFISSENLPLLGRVSMDSIMLESTKETICLFHDAKEASKQLGTISYEVTTALSGEIKRKIV